VVERRFEGEPKPWAQHALLLGLLFLFPSLALRTQLGTSGAHILLTLVMVVVLGCFFGLARSRSKRIVAVLLALGELSLPFLPGVEDGAHEPIRVALSLLIVGLMVAALTRNLFRRQTFTAATVSSTLSLYLLLGLGWSNVYEIIYMINPAAFSSSGLVEYIEMQSTAESRRAELEALLESGDELSMEDLRLSTMLDAPPVDFEASMLYYSFVTLTTLGYGDITPRSPLAMALTTLEAIVGQLFLVVIVARAVALSVIHEQQVRNSSSNHGRDPP